MNKDITFIPATNRNKNEKIGKDVIERNQEFIAKKNQKI